jgi:hypothetical protein
LGWSREETRLAGRLEQSFAQRLTALPDDARQLLVLAPAEPVGDRLLLLRAANQHGIQPGAAGAVGAEGLLAISERVTFRYPLVRSTVHRSASVQERRAAHLALADATDRDIDPDGAVWHLAAAAAGPDESVASELERSAGGARSRRGVAASAAFLRRALELTADPARRAARRRARLLLRRRALRPASSMPPFGSRPPCRPERPTHGRGLSGAG